MRALDAVGLAAGAVRAHRRRSTLAILGIAIGVAAVTLLTAIGEGTRQHLIGQFTQFGTNILTITPGKTETLGIPGVLGGTTQKLTLDDAVAIERLHVVETVVPMVVGQARVERGRRGRSVYVYGVNHSVPELWKFPVGQGRFLPEGDMRRAASIAVLGPRLKREIFGEENALGQFVRVAGERLRVIGVMRPKGRLLGFDVDDSVYVPVATAMRMFNQDELREIDVTFDEESPPEPVVAAVSRVLADRHRGKVDFTVTTQQAMLDVFGKVLDGVTAALGAIAGISILVGAVGILTVMWISVGERTAEIGLLRALGATARDVHRLFLLEAMSLAVLGAVIGVAVSAALVFIARLVADDLPVRISLTGAAAAVSASILTGVVSGVAPAWRASRLEPIAALRAE